MITPSIIAGPVLLALVAQVPSGPRLEAVRALRIGQWRTAAESLRASLEDNPEDPELLARLGLAYFQLGLYSDAESAFRNAAGSAWYELQGVGAHAATLRELGMFDDLGELRQAQILNADDESGLNTALLGAADDAIAQGDLDQALEWAEQALALRPSSPTAHAWLADIHQRRGDDEAAGFHLWLAELDGYRANRATELHVRIALEDSALLEALEIVEDGRQGRRRNAELAVLQAEIYRRLGWLDDAEAVFERQFVHYGERRDYLVERGQLLRAQGDGPGGCASLARAAQLYPHHPLAAALLVEHGCAEATDP
jgi:tetratricopeptide (TPR) repeat protein